MAIEGILLILAIGVLLGMKFGRWRAENLRARSDMHKVWNARKGYRKGPFY
jgi:hypothetical protein